MTVSMLLFLSVNTTCTNDTCDNITTTTESDAQETGVQIFSPYIAYFVLFVGAIGLIGNILTFIIIFPHIKEKGIYLFFFALSICDFIYVFMAVLYMSFLNLSHGSMDIISLTGCHILPFLSFLSGQLSSWLLVGVTVERCAVLYFPHYGRYHFTSQKVVIYIAGMCIMLSVLNFPFLGGLMPAGDTLDVLDKCIAKTPATGYYYLQVFRKLDFAVYVMVPGSIIVVLNSLIVRKMWQLQKTIHPMTPNSKAGIKCNTIPAGTSNTDNRKHISIIPVGVPNKDLTAKADATANASSRIAEFDDAAVVGHKCTNQNEIVIKHTEARSNLEVQTDVETADQVRRKQLYMLTKSCVMLSLFFISSTLPLALITLISYGPTLVSHPTKYRSVMLALNISFSVSIINHCANCIIYCLAGIKFRNKLKKLLECLKIR